MDPFHLLLPPSSHRQHPGPRRHPTPLPRRSQWVTQGVCLRVPFPRAGKGWLCVAPFTAETPARRSKEHEILFEPLGFHSRCLDVPPSHHHPGAAARRRRAQHEPPPPCRLGLIRISGDLLAVRGAADHLQHSPQVTDKAVHLPLGSTRSSWRRYPTVSRRCLHRASAICVSLRSRVPPAPLRTLNRGLVSTGQVPTQH